MAGLTGNAMTRTMLVMRLADAAGVAIIVCLLSPLLLLVLYGILQLFATAAVLW